jgi:hypothetical protein
MEVTEGQNWKTARNITTIVEWDDGDTPSFMIMIRLQRIRTRSQNKHQKRPRRRGA